MTTKYMSKFNEIFSPFIEKFDKKYPYHIRSYDSGFGFTLEYNMLYGEIREIIYNRMITEDGKWIYLSVADKELIWKEIEESEESNAQSDKRSLTEAVVDKILEIRRLREALKIISERYPNMRDTNSIVKEYLGV